MTCTTRHDSSDPDPVPVPVPGSPAVRASGSGSRRAAAAALAGVLLLAGCTGGEPEPEESELPLPASVTASASPSASVSPEPSEEAEAEGPERPAAMDKKDADGAAAAAEYILSLEKPMMVTGDTAEWEARSHRSCEYCESRLDQAKTIAQRGDVFTGGDVEVVVDKVYQRDVVTGIWPMDITGHESATTILDAKGETVFTSESAVAERRAELALRDGEWVLVELGQIPEK